MPDHVDVNQLEAELREAIRGEVRFDALTRGIHATDASFYQDVPCGVAWPVDEQDVLTVLAVARRHGVSVTARGAGTSLSGQTFGRGIILDVSRHMDRVLEVDAGNRCAWVEPGVIRDRLNQQLAKLGLHFAPDPATTSRATIGGMIGNNASGSRSVIYGMTSHHILALKVALIDGTVLTLESCDDPQWRDKADDTNPNAVERRLYREADALAQRYRPQIQQHFPRTMRRVGGYALDHLAGLPADTGHPPCTPDARRQQAGMPPVRSLARLICGSEGTLAVVLAAKINLEPVPGGTALLLLHHATLGEALRSVGACLAHQPSAVELLDENVVNEARTNASTAHLADAFEGRPAAVNVVEFQDASPQAAAARADALAEQLAQQNVGYAQVVCRTAASQQRVWELRKQGLGLLTHRPGPAKAIDFIDDAAIPIDRFASYIEKVVELCDSVGIKVPLYAHASVGLLHVKPVIDLHRADQVELMHQIAQRAFELCIAHGGAFSGEHGDGIVRGEFVARQFGPELTEAFAQLKRLFDPAGLLNPNRIIDAPAMTSHLRTTAGPALPNHQGDAHAGYNLRLAQVSTRTSFAHASQGGFGQAIEQCNGVGACRKLDAGTMCPSYMATRNEEHSTRGRANALRLAMTGQLPELAHPPGKAGRPSPSDQAGLPPRVAQHNNAGPSGSRSASDLIERAPVEDALASLASDRVKQALDLCLSCKACKQECPNSVDMAKLKADVSQLRHDRRGVPLSARVLGNLPLQANLLAGRLAILGAIADWLPGGRAIIEKLIGIDRRRPMPRFARVPLKRALKRAGLTDSGSPERDAPDLGDGNRQSAVITQDADPAVDGDPAVDADPATDPAIPGPAESAQGTTVALFADTWTRTMEPSQGVQAHRLLQGLGYHVRWADVGCCQRTRLSQGLVKDAKRAGARTVARLDAHFAQQGIPILCLEPSCASALVDDLPDLVDDKAAAGRVASHVKMLDAYLADQMQAGAFLASQLTAPSGKYLVHGHCHQKSVLPGDGVQRLLNAIEGVQQVQTLDAGCCGMAGAFGYQHHDVSVAVAQDRYLPALRQAAAQGTHLLADGLSCRHQAHDLAGLKVHHWIDLVQARSPGDRPTSDRRPA